MVQLQIISKILSTGKNDIVEDNLLDSSYFIGYEEEYTFIQNHIKQYGNVPDKATFLAKFPDIELVEVTETDSFLVDAVREEYLYHQSVPVLQNAAELLKTDANAAAEYMVQALQSLQPNYKLGGVDIIADAQSRFEQFKERKEHQEEWFFTTGFQELDGVIHGIQRQEELFVLFARVNQGKSWVLEKICTHVWGLGMNIGFVSPEMSANNVGFRFDTLHNNFSNKGLMWGKKEIEDVEYQNYIKTLQTQNNRFIVATPLDFDRKITVTKLKNWIKQYKLDLVAIDGITYMTDERMQRGDNKTTSLTNISEDLMSLSMELKLPILVVVQANREAAKDKESEAGPDLEHIRDSDGIAHNASKVLSIRQKKDNVLELCVKKQRFGAVGAKINYTWDIDTGAFTYIPTYEDGTRNNTAEIRKVKKQYNDKEDVF